MTTRQILTIAVDDTADISSGQLAETVHRMIPGSHTLQNTSLEDADLVTGFEWDEQSADADDLPALPISAEEARELIATGPQETEDFLTVIAMVSQQQYLRAYARFITADEEDHYDLLHQKIYGFGMPYDAETRILAVQGNDFVVSYTTDIREALDDTDDLGTATNHRLDQLADAIKDQKVP